MRLTARLEAWFLAGSLIFVAGMGAGWMLWSPEKKQKVDPPAQAQRQEDGSLVLERKPDPAAKPAQKVPKGARVERVVQVVVQPSAQPVEPLRPSGSDASVGDNLTPTEPVSTAYKLPPVRVDLSLIRMPDKTLRVLVSSPDGTVLDGVDIPVEAGPPLPRRLLWAAGASYDPGNRTYGGWVERDLGPLRVGADVLQVREPLAAGGRVGWAGLIRAGIRF